MQQPTLRMPSAEAEEDMAAGTRSVPAAFRALNGCDFTARMAVLHLMP